VGASAYVGVDNSLASLNSARERITLMKALANSKAHFGRATTVVPIPPTILLLQHDLVQDEDFADVDYRTGTAPHTMIPSPSPWQPFDVVSIQFAMHYMFETFDTVRRLVTTMVTHTKPGSVVCATVLDGAVVAHRILSSPRGTTSLGNRFFRISWDEDTRERLTRGCRYGCAVTFTLPGAVSGLKEYLVSLDVLDMHMSHAFVPLWNKPFGEMLKNPELRLQQPLQGRPMDRDMWEVVCMYRALAWGRKPVVTKKGAVTRRDAPGGDPTRHRSWFKKDRPFKVGVPVGTPASKKTGDKSLRIVVPTDYKYPLSADESTMNPFFRNNPWSIGSKHFLHAVGAFADTVHTLPNFRRNDATR
jgi:hypothetical protein